MGIVRYSCTYAPGREKARASRLLATLSIRFLEVLNTFIATKRYGEWVHGPQSLDY